MAQTAAQALNGKRASLGEVRSDTAERAHAAHVHGQDARIALAWCDRARAGPDAPASTK